MVEQKIPNRVVRMKELVTRLGYAKSTIHGLIKENRFPAPFKLTPNGRAVGWFDTTIDDWILSMGKDASDQNKKVQQDV